MAEDWSTELVVMTPTSPTRQLDFWGPDKTWCAPEESRPNMGYLLNDKQR